MTDSLETLNLSSINLEEDGAKKLGIALSKSLVDFKKFQILNDILFEA